MENKKSILSIVIIAMAVLMILLVMILVGTKKTKKDNDNTTTTTTTTTGINNDKKDKVVSATCEKTFSGYENMTVSYLVEIALDNNNVLSAKTSIKSVYKIEQDFQIASEMEKDAPNTTFDKKNLTKLVLQTEEDFTKEQNGILLKISYENYIKPLENQGYVCKK